MPLLPKGSLRGKWLLFNKLLSQTHVKKVLTKISGGSVKAPPVHPLHVLACPHRIKVLHSGQNMPHLIPERFS
jgi:hypothetical protein